MATPAVGVRVSVSEREASRREGIAKLFSLLTVTLRVQILW